MQDGVEVTRCSTRGSLSLVTQQSLLSSSPVQFRASGGSLRLLDEIARALSADRPSDPWHWLVRWVTINNGLNPSKSPPTDPEPQTGPLAIMSPPSRRRTAWPASTTPRSPPQGLSYLPSPTPSRREGRVVPYLDGHVSVVQVDDMAGDDEEYDPQPVPIATGVLRREFGLQGLRSVDSKLVRKWMRSASHRCKVLEEVIEELGLEVQDTQDSLARAEQLVVLSEARAAMKRTAEREAHEWTEVQHAACLVEIELQTACAIRLSNVECEAEVVLGEVKASEAIARSGLTIAFATATQRMTLDLEAERMALSAVAVEQVFRLRVAEEEAFRRITCSFIVDRASIIQDSLTARVASLKRKLVKGREQAGRCEIMQHEAQDLASCALARLHGAVAVAEMRSFPAAPAWEEVSSLAATCPAPSTAPSTSLSLLRDVARESLAGLSLGLVLRAADQLPPVHQVAPRLRRRKSVLRTGYMRRSSSMHSRAQSPSFAPAEMEDWLQKLDIDEYSKHVIATCKVTQTGFMEMTSSDFKALGIESSRARKRILKAVQKMLSEREWVDEIEVGDESRALLNEMAAEHGGLAELNTDELHHFNPKEKLAIVKAIMHVRSLMSRADEETLSRPASSSSLRRSRSRRIESSRSPASDDKRLSSPFVPIPTAPVEVNAEELAELFRMNLEHTCESPDNPVQGDAEAGVKAEEHSGEVKAGEAEGD
eukprot:Sspe_Gene.115095::Locus_102008_Transcript_1_1_Confidence_1.000_Length_2182::g.115095::m.115095